MLGPTAFLTKGKPGQGASGLGLGPTDTLTGGRKTAALAGDANEASSAHRKGAGEDGRRKAKKNPDQERPHTARYPPCTTKLMADPPPSSSALPSSP